MPNTKTLLSLEDAEIEAEEDRIVARIVQYSS